MAKISINRKTTNKKKGSASKKNTQRESEFQKGKDQSVKATDGKRKKK